MVMQRSEKQSGAVRGQTQCHCPKKRCSGTGCERRRGMARARTGSIASPRPPGLFIQVHQSGWI